MQNIPRKRIYIALILAIIAITAGGLFLYMGLIEQRALIEQNRQDKLNHEQVEIFNENESNERNKVLFRNQATGVNDLAGKYKKVTVSDGSTTFSFEAPDKWLIETRNSGEIEMDEEELREFFATNYDGDIRSKEVCNDVSVIDYSNDSAGVRRTERMCGQPSGDYWDFTWDMLKGKSYGEMKSLLARNDRGDLLPNYPNASLSSSDYIWYTDNNGYQTDFYILPLQDAKKYWNLYSKDKSVDDITIDGKTAKVVADESNEGKGSGSRKIFIPLADSKALFINKQFYPKGAVQEDFDHLLDTLKFESVLKNHGADTNQSETQKFVVDVDLNTDHWQSKETEFFSAKFPREWYWLEGVPSTTGARPAHVITNNPDFPLEENQEIGLFAEIGPTTQIKIDNDTEFVMAERGIPTKNAGTPEDSLQSIFSLARSNYPKVTCGRFTELGVVPIQAWCTAVYSDHQMQQTFYSIDRVWSLEKTAWTTDATLVKRAALRSVAENFMLKGY